MVSQREGAKIVEDALDTGPTPVGAQGQCASLLSDVQGCRTILNVLWGARGRTDGSTLRHGAQEPFTGREIDG